MTFSKKDIQIIGKKNLYKGFFSMNKYEFVHPLFEGGISDVVAREVFERGHAVAVLPYDPVKDELVLLEQLRFPAMETSDSPWMIEIVAGIIEENEDLEDVCIREAQEEAGIKITDLTPTHSYLSSPGACTERIYSYIARVDAGTAHGIHGLDYEAEDIKVHRVPLEIAKCWLNEGKIDNAIAIIALQWLLLNKDALLTQWQVTHR